MQSSFFQNTPFKIIERKIYECNVTIEETKEILVVYDFIAWKLTTNSDKTPISTLSSFEQEINATKEKHQQPFGLCITTAEEAEIAAKYANFLYIPGEFCRQSDVLDAAKSTQKPIVVEKGIFLSPNDIKRLCEKIQGSDYALVDCGSSYGYSDSILDPRSLFLMQKNACYFGVSLSDLFAPKGTHYTHRPQWLNSPEFTEAFIKMSKAFEVSFFVIKNYGNGKLEANTILNLLK